ncbi:(Na+)-NQR maturation NqrM [Sessilibacter corallicola]|uniref:(Na+)-NQR maturation NqrM n=1 Tax=Sessilibacter corallicola TaxID=2904075 RepID=A0ABQ0ADM3_9GAMM
MTFVVTLAALLLVVTAMSVGVIMGRKPITGSCGGVGAALGEEDYVCDLCGGDEAKCEELLQQDSGKNAFLAYEAKTEKKH